MNCGYGLAENDGIRVRYALEIFTFNILLKFQILAVICNSAFRPALKDILNIFGIKNNSFVGIFRFGEQNLGVIFHPKTSLETADFPYLKI